jgi:DNA damage-binding protein 1
MVLPNEIDPAQGRLLVFRVDDQKLTLISERDTKGAVFRCTGFNGKLLTGINNRVCCMRC